MEQESQSVSIIAGFSNGGDFSFDLREIMLKVRAGFQFMNNSLGKYTSGINVRQVAVRNFVRST
jgi:hypothetical protein